MAMHFLTHTFMNRHHQSMLSLLRKVMGTYIHSGWYVFSPGAGRQTARTTLLGIQALCDEVTSFIQNPIRAFTVRPYFIHIYFTS